MIVLVLGRQLNRDRGLDDPHTIGDRNFRRVCLAGRGLIAMAGRAIGSARVRVLALAQGLACSGT